MSFLFDTGPTMTLGEYRLLRELINRYCGMTFADGSRYIFERRLRPRLKELGLGNFTEYYHQLLYHSTTGNELDAAVDLLVTNETYFFREEYQLKAFRDELLPRLKVRLEQQGRRSLSLWSAGCSTGEEVYTLAMLVDESRLFSGWDVRIFGSDISPRVLNVARKGSYGRSSFRVMPRSYDCYFTPDSTDNTKRRVVPYIRSMCHFGCLNLLDRRRAVLVGRTDAIFCRNVLIYFDEIARRKVVDTLHDRLYPGGYLLLGHSESLFHYTTAFELVHLKTDMVYRRPETPLFESGGELS